MSAIASPSNLGIPVIGKLLPMLGGLFILDSMGQMKKFMEAVRYHVEKKRCIVIYPAISRYGIPISTVIQCACISSASRSKSRTEMFSFMCSGFVVLGIMIIPC